MITINHKMPETIEVPKSVPFMLYSRRYSTHYMVFYDSTREVYGIIRLENGYRQSAEAKTAHRLVHEVLKEHDVELLPFVEFNVL
jgi:hypothetical protein